MRRLLAGLGALALCLALTPELAYAQAAAARPGWFVSIGAGALSALVVALGLAVWTGSRDVFWVFFVIVWIAATFLIRYDM
jgi:hypothetical protein